MPVVKFIERLYLEKIISSMDRHKLVLPREIQIVRKNGDLCRCVILKEDYIKK